jgi:hypothetical protein
MPSSPTPQAETRAQKLERARREARFKFALDRVAKINAGQPPLTKAQRTELARRILTPDGDAA